MTTHPVCLKYAAACILCVVWAVGCSSSDAGVATTSHEGASVARLSALASRIERPHPHPHRKPLRDARARTMRLIAAEANELLTAPSAEALTGDGGAAPRPAVRSAVEAMRDAARNGDAIGVSLAYHRLKAAE